MATPNKFHIRRPLTVGQQQHGTTLNAYGIIHATLQIYLQQEPSYLRAARQLLS